jgi:hypothetical protein
MRQGEWGVWYEAEETIDGLERVRGWVATWDDWEEYSGTEASAREKAAHLNESFPDVRHEARRLPESADATRSGAK